MLGALAETNRALLEALTKALETAPPLPSAPPGGYAAWFEPLGQLAELGRAALDEAGKAPTAELAKLAGDWWADQLRLWSDFVAGRPSSLPPNVRTNDPRFSGEAWEANPVFDLLRKSYLLAAHHALEGTHVFDKLSPGMAERLRFHTRQLVEAMSPANFALLNPEVLRRAQETGGQSLVKGLENLARDLAQGKLTMTDETAFEVGRNVAATPGKVVFRNRMFELIHYQPTTETVFEVPLLIFPPWINKFYILDLTPEKSFIRWAVDQGLSVFVVSWAQASEKTADATLDTYVEEGFLTAIDVVREICGVPSVHAIGYCVAGTTLAVVLALLAARGEAEKVATATFFTAQTDFSDAGDLLHFVDDQMLATIEKLGASGVFDGRYLALTFNLLRPTDLLWNYVVNNYMLGKEYVPFDLLYWNSDPTNVPAKWHLAYLKDFYRDNLLAKPGGISVLGTPIDLGLIRTPAYIQAGKEDHIAPAASVWKLTQQLKGPVRFVLAGSGHIAGVINPPAANKYMHWTLPEGTPLPATLDAFQALAKETKGSWWPDWIAWLAPRSGGRVPARIPGTHPAYPPLDDAPGPYVKERIA
ncbi:PHA/PHB synthase family protein [Thermaurantiacus tibetensis]|uniref:PHA/PHB synthase family protein n=1 Tax=Thermaurantiacus tibetensis TaxID=2759035 RepID=UPI00188FDD7B|nr:class I poly(R)-hydroxyalkanoic acid synthase [Thermaurantiacus tibetensis]